VGRRPRDVRAVSRRTVRNLALHRQGQRRLRFGAAGSLAVLLVWIYYSSQIVLFGAEFTRVYANAYGSHIVVADNAIPVPETPLARQAMEKKIKDGDMPNVAPEAVPVRPGR